MENLRRHHGEHLSLIHVLEQWLLYQFYLCTGAREHVQCGNGAAAVLFAAGGDPDPGAALFPGRRDARGILAHERGVDHAVVILPIHWFVCLRRQP